MNIDMMYCSPRWFAKKSSRPQQYVLALAGIDHRQSTYHWDEMLVESQIRKGLLETCLENPRFWVCLYACRPCRTCARWLSFNDLWCRRGRWSDFWSVWNFFHRIHEKTIQHSGRYRRIYSNTIAFSLIYLWHYIEHTKIQDLHLVFNTSS